MSALDDQAKKVRAAITEYDTIHACAVFGDSRTFLLADAAKQVIGETEALLTILAQQREPI